MLPNSDTFTGVYAAEFIRQQREKQPWDIERAVRRACAAGALTVTKAGAQEGIPWANEIDDLMNLRSSVTLLGDEAKVQH